MAKYKVEVGGYVSVYRQRMISVFTDSKEEAEEKAICKFMELKQKNGGDMCDKGTINKIELID